jgi:hypothetical protein
VRSRRPLLGLLEGGPRTLVAVIRIYRLINVTIQTITQPKVVGDGDAGATELVPRPKRRCPTLIVRRRRRGSSGVDEAACGGRVGGRRPGLPRGVRPSAYSNAP